MKRKIFLILIISVSLTFARDFNNSGVIKTNELNKFDLNGDGVINSLDNSTYPFNIPVNSSAGSNASLSFSPFWESPPGAFTNCWDGVCGYFDGDTLLDVAGFTFSPAKFYIYEQSPANPGTFTLVQEFIKAEGGSFGPITFGDTDGDGKIEIISADVLGIARVYIYENDGNNNYVAQPTFSHPSNGEGGQGIYIGDLNKNGKKEIIVLRGTSSGGEVRVWEQTGAIGSNTYTNIYTYSTVSYIFGKGGYGDSDNDGWDEVLISFGGFPIYNTFIRRIEFDSASSSFQHQIFEAGSIGFPTSYKVYDLNNDGIKELISTNNSNGQAASYIYRSNGPNSYVVLDSIFEPADNNSMMSLDIKVLSGNSLSSIVYGSFNGRVYIYSSNVSSHIKEYENTAFPGSAIRRVYWVPWTGYDGYFNTWSSQNSNGTFYIFKRTFPVGIQNNQIPVSFNLYDNYPNPFNPSTTIKFDLPISSNVKLFLYDANGKNIEKLINSYLQSGTHTITWDAKNYSSGIYFYRLETGQYTQTKKMVLIK